MPRMLSTYSEIMNLNMSEEEFEAKKEEIKEKMKNIHSYLSEKEGEETSPIQLKKKVIDDMDIDLDEEDIYTIAMLFTYVDDLFNTPNNKIKRSDPNDMMVV